MAEPIRPDLAEFLTGRVPDDVRAIFEAFASASTALRDTLATAPLAGLLGVTGATNVQNEAVARLDDVANDIFKEALRLPSVVRLISEEESEPIDVGDGRYTVCFDPLDGSSNIGMASVGSVMGIYDGIASPVDHTPVTGRSLVGSAFTVYGLPSILVLATREGVDGFAFDPADRTWRLAFPSMRVPEAQYTSINWTYRDRWPANVASAVDHASDGLRGRYSGSMVEDILRVLLAGGVFLYPEDSASPGGKLRMLYEICPIGLIMEAAGGAASNGEMSVLDVAITAPHQRGPLIAGASVPVDRYREKYSR